MGIGSKIGNFRISDIINVKVSNKRDSKYSVILYIVPNGMANFPGLNS